MGTLHINSVMSMDFQSSRGRGRAKEIWSECGVVHPLQYRPTEQRSPSGDLVLGTLATGSND